MTSEKHLPSGIGHAKRHAFSKTTGKGLTLIGFRHSVYTRIVKMALIEMDLPSAYIEVDPFADTPDPLLLQHSAFGRVPVLSDGAFSMTETAAILRYLDRIGKVPSLVPEDPKAAARMAQIIGIVDSYAYNSLIHMVFSHGFYRPHFGETHDSSMVVQGVKDSGPVLDMLDRIAQEGLQLTGDPISLADIHLAPMIAYFLMTTEGGEMLPRYSALHMWWTKIKSRPALVQTDPFAL